MRRLPAAGHHSPTVICACLRRSCLAAKEAACRNPCPTLPMSGSPFRCSRPVESLNVAIAAALVIYEAARQRHPDRVHVAL